MHVEERDLLQRCQVRLETKNRNIFQENDISSDCKLEPSHLEYWIKGKLLKVNFDPQSVVGAVLIVDMGHLSQDQVKKGKLS